MKVNELRIGNYIELDGKVESIWEISMDYQDEGFPLFSAGTTSLVEFRECRHKPMPLTEEWLEKFGFYETSRYGKYLEFNINQEQSLRLPICKHSERDFWYVLRGSVKIQYVHQLQNLYFALTGEELTIKS